MGKFSNSMKQTIFFLLSLSHVVPLLLVLPSLASTTNKGHISIDLSRKGIDFAKDVLIEKALTSIIPLEISDIEKSVKIPIVGSKVRLGLTNISVYSASVGFSSVVTSTEEDGIVLVASGVEGFLNMKWFYSYKSWFVVISDSGGASVKVNDMEVRLLLDVKEHTGAMKLSLLDCKCSVNDISIKLNGGASWLYQVLVDAFERPIGYAIEKAVSKKIREGIAKLDDKLQSLPKQIAVDNIAALNSTFVNDPLFGNFSIGYEVDGLFVAADNSPAGKYYYSGTRVASDSCDDSSKMIAISVHGDVFDSAASVYFTAGYMHWIVDQFSDQSLLNTSSWKYLYPELYEEYPDAAAKLNVSLVSQPVIKILEGDVDAAIELHIVASVLDANEVTPVAIVSLVINTSGTPRLVTRNLAGTIKLKNFTLALRWSKIGGLDMHLFEAMTSTILETMFIPYVNKHIIKGFPLPIIRGFALKNADIHCMASTMLICSNLVATRPAFRGRTQYVHENTCSHSSELCSRYK